MNIKIKKLIKKIVIWLLKQDFIEIKVIYRKLLNFYLNIAKL